MSSQKNTQVSGKNESPVNTLGKGHTSTFRLRIGRALCGWSLCALLIPWEHFTHLTNFGYFRGKYLLHLFKDMPIQWLGHTLFKLGVPSWLSLLLLGMLVILFIYGFIFFGRKLTKAGVIKKREGSFVEEFIMKLSR